MTLKQIYPKTTPSNLTDDTIARIENNYHVKYVGVFCLGDGKQWRNDPIDIFYQPNPNVELGHSNYMGYFISNGHGYLTNGAGAVVGVTFDAAVAKDGEIIYSSYRHDCQVSADGTAWIDGGRDYTRRGECAMTQFIVVEDKFFEVD
jgi:hypothetical protein